MAKKMLYLLTSLLFAALLLCSIFAAETTVYVGAKQEYTTLESAIDALNGKGGTVVICDTVTVSEELTVPEQSGDLTVTANGGALNFTAKTLTLAKNENGNVFTFNAPITTPSGGLTLFGGFNSLVFDSGFAVNGVVHFYGGVDAPDGPTNVTTSKVEESRALNEACITTLPYSITVRNGNFDVFAGGNRRSGVAALFGSIAAPLTVTVEGGTFTYAGSATVTDALKTEQAFSLSGMSILADDATLIIKGGKFDTPIYAVSYFYPNKTEASACSQVTNSDPKYYAMDGDVTLSIEGGTFTENCYEITAVQKAAAFNLLLRGNYTLSVKEGVSLPSGITLDATQVKAYEGADKKAVLSYAGDANAIRFDVVNGEAKIYTEPLRIACVGDSITQGTNAGDFGKKSYPAQMYAKMHAAGMDAVVSNFGCGGWTVMNYDGKYYPAGLAYTLSVKETDPDVVIIGLGTNDSRFFNTVGQHKHFTDSYRALIEAYTTLSSTSTVYGTGAIYRFGKLSTEASQFVRRHQEEVFRTLAAEGNAKAKYIDLYELLLADACAGNLLSGDNLHPNASGYTLYANAVYDVLFGSGITEKPVQARTEIYVDFAGGKKGASGSETDPVKYLADAYELADRTAKVVTVYIVGTYNFADREESTDTTNTPYDVQKLRFVGKADANGNKGVWCLSTKYMNIGCDTEFDNLTLEYHSSSGSASAIYIHCGFNSVTFTESFTTTGQHVLYAGHNVYNDDPAAKRYTPAESVSSDKDVTLEVLGGKFYYIYGGNNHYDSANVANKAPYGTYGGNMTLHIGKGVSLASSRIGAINGMNYLTGSITAKIDAWNAGQPILEYSPVTNASTVEYIESNNTGSITILSTVDNPIVYTRDFNKDGNFNVADVVYMVSCMMRGTPDDFDSQRFYDRSEVTLLHVIRALKALVK